MYPETSRSIQVDSETPLRYVNGFIEGFGLGCIITIALILLIS